MNERRDDWAQAFGESVGIVAIGFRLLGITQDDAARFRSAKRTTNQRVRLPLLQPVDRPSTGSVGRVSLPCVSF
jgi:hypothetical protein